MWLKRIEFLYYWFTPLSVIQHCPYNPVHSTPALKTASKIMHDLCCTFSTDSSYRKCLENHALVSYLDLCAEKNVVWLLNMYWTASFIVYSTGVINVEFVGMCAPYSIHANPLVSPSLLPSNANLLLESVPLGIPLNLSLKSVPSYPLLLPLCIL